jgi:hypothetical protein
VEASLLPSKVFRALCKQVIVAVVRRDAPECRQLRQEFAVPVLNSWVVVLNAQGEVLAGWIGDDAGAGCRQDGVQRFPGNLVRLIRMGLERTESVEELERRWREQPHDGERFEALSRRLEEMHRYETLRRLCEEAAEDSSLPPLQRDEFRIRAFLARAETPFNPDRRFVQEGEKLLVELASHPRAAGLAQALFSRGFAHSFDVPGRSARAIARLERAAGKSAAPAALQDRIRELAALLEQWTTETRQFLDNNTDAEIRDYFAALLGDAEAAIKLFSRAPYKDQPQFRGWLQEARRKQQRERK